MKVILFFVTLFFSLSPVFHVYAQAGDASSGGEIATSTTTGSSTESEATYEGAPVGPESKASEVSAAPTSSPSTSTTPEGASRGTSSSALVPPNVPLEAVTTAVPSSTGEADVSAPPAPQSLSKEKGSVAPAQVSSAMSVVPLAVAGVLICVFGGIFLALRTKKQHTQKNDPCGALKEQYESSQVAHDAMTRNITLQELLVAELKKEIEHAENTLKEKIKEYAADVTQEIMEDVLEKEKNENVRAAVQLAGDAKAAYDDLVKEYKLAGDLLEVLKGKKQGLADEVREKEAVFNMCMQSVAHAHRGALAGGVEFTADGEIRALRGVIIENSLRDKSILPELKIRRTWQEEDWTLHDVEITEKQAFAMQHFLKEGPWCIHFWEQGDDKALVVFKDNVFYISHSNKDTWKEAAAYGMSRGIPGDQLDFANNDFTT